MVPTSLKAVRSASAFCLVTAPLVSTGRSTAIFDRRQNFHVGSAGRTLNCSIAALSIRASKRQGQEWPSCPTTPPAPKRKIILRTAIASGWDQTTSRCVELSTIAFIFLLMPQVVKNHLSASSGNSEALAVLSWVGYLTSLFGNVLLLGCFVDKQEGGATAVQAIGALANYAMLTQIWLAKLMPSVAYLPLTALMASAGLVNGCKFFGALNASSGQGLWRNWQDFLGVLGIAMLPQAIWATCSKHHTMIPAYTASVVALTYLIMARRKQLPDQLQGLWSDIPAWTATMLFMFQPVAQSVSSLLIAALHVVALGLVISLLMSNFKNPSTLEGLSMASILLGMLGNGLMVPRALYTQDKIWFLGVGWGPLMGWVQLLSLYVAHGITGTRYLSGVWFTAMSVALITLGYAILQRDHKAKGLQSPFQSLEGLIRSQPDPQCVQQTT